MKRSSLALSFILLIPTLVWGGAVYTFTSITPDDVDLTQAKASVNAVLDLSDFSYFHIGFYDKACNVMKEIPLELSKDPETGEIVASEEAIIRFEVKYGGDYEIKIKADAPPDGQQNVIHWKATALDEEENVVGSTGKDVSEIKDYEADVIHRHTDGDYVFDEYDLRIETVNLSDLTDGAVLEAYLTVSLEVG